MVSASSRRWVRCTRGTSRTSSGRAAVFVPSLEEMYPPGDQTRVTPGTIAVPLEGAARPGHFVGVATVVVKLLGIVHPDVAYLGQKDFQQLRVIQTVVRDLALGVRIAGGPTVREADRLTNAVRRQTDGPGIAIEYVSAADPMTLAELHAPADRAVISLAARVGNARLIDNVLLGMDVSELGD